VNPAAAAPSHPIPFSTRCQPLSHSDVPARCPRVVPTLFDVIVAPANTHGRLHCCLYSRAARIHHPL